MDRYRWVHRGSGGREGLLVLLLLGGYWYGTNLPGGLWMDEVKFLRAGYSMLHGFFYGNPTHMHAPLVKYVFALSQAVLGPTAFAGRVVGVLFGLGTIAVLYELIRWRFGPYSAVAAGATLLVSQHFAALSTSAYLDVPFTFFVTVLGGSLLLWAQSPTRRSLWFVGAATVCVGAAKLQGALFVLPVPLLLLAGATSEGDWRTATREILSPFLQGMALTGAVIYTPIFLSPHPAAYGGYELSPLAHALFSLPGLGNIAYAFAGSTAQNLGHLAQGHGTVVAGTTYANPPNWTYIYWLFSKGTYVYLLGLVSVFAYPALVLMADWRSERRLAIYLCFFLAVPLTIHSLMNVKSFRYLVPFFPLLLFCLVGATHALYRWIPAQMHPLVKGRRVAGWVVVVLLLFSLAVSPAVGPTVPIRSDSGYDRATAYIVSEKPRETQSQFTVVTTNALVFRWYLGAKSTQTFNFDSSAPKAFDINGDSRPDVTVVGATGTDRWNRTKRYLERGDVCFIVDDRNARGIVEDDIYKRVNASSKAVRYISRRGRTGQSLSDLAVFRTC